MVIVAVFVDTASSKTRPCARKLAYLIHLRSSHMELAQHICPHLIVLSRMAKTAGSEAMEEAAIVMIQATQLSDSVK